jgi:hypothetical protein
MKPIIRFFHVLESIQYAVLYMLTAFFAGVGLDFAFPHYDPKKPVPVIRREVIFQCIALVLVVYLTRLFVKNVPILFPIPSAVKYRPYETAEFNGEMMMGLVFLGVQLNLVQKMDFLAEKLYEWIFSEERKGRANGAEFVHKMKTDKTDRNKQDTS